MAEEYSGLPKTQQLPAHL